MLCQEIKKQRTTLPLAQASSSAWEWLRLYESDKPSFIRIVYVTGSELEIYMYFSQQCLKGVVEMKRVWFRLIISVISWLLGFGTPTMKDERYSVVLTTNINTEDLDLFEISCAFMEFQEDVFANFFFDESGRIIHIDDIEETKKRFLSPSDSYEGAFRNKIAKKLLHYVIMKDMNFRRILYFSDSREGCHVV